MAFFWSPNETIAMLRITLAGPMHTAKCPTPLNQIGLIFMQCLSALPHDSRPDDDAKRWLSP